MFPTRYSRSWVCEYERDESMNELSKKKCSTEKKGGKNDYIQPTLTRRSNTSQIHRQISQNDFQKDFDVFHDNICTRDRFDI